MREESDRRRSPALARRALLTVALMAVAGSALGLFAMRFGMATGIQICLIGSSLLFSASTVAALLASPKIPLQTVA